MICVEIDQGVVVASLDVAPSCTQYALATANELGRVTFWADLAIELDPSGSSLYPLMAAILLVFATAWGIKQIARIILNR